MYPDKRIAKVDKIHVCSLYGACFHVRWIFLTTIPPELLVTRAGFGDEWSEIHLTWKSIQNAFSRILYTSRHVC